MCYLSLLFIFLLLSFFWPANSATIEPKKIVILVLFDYIYLYYFLLVAKCDHFKVLGSHDHIKILNQFRLYWIVDFYMVTGESLIKIQKLKTLQITEEYLG